MKVREIMAIIANKTAHKRQDEMSFVIKERVMLQIDKATKEGRFCTYLACKDYSDCSNWAVIENWLKELGYKTEYAPNYKGMVVAWDDISIAELSIYTKAMKGEDTYVDWRALEVLKKKQTIMKGLE